MTFRLRFYICLRVLLTYPINSENIFCNIIRVNLLCHLSFFLGYERTLEKSAKVYIVMAAFRKYFSCSRAAFSRVSRHSVSSSGPLKRETEQIFRNYVIFSEAINFHSVFPAMTQRSIVKTISSRTKEFIHFDRSKKHSYREKISLNTICRVFFCKYSPYRT